MDLLFQKLQQFCSERSLECYLVGGSLRDLLLGQQPQDLDLTVRGDPEQIAHALADELKGRYVALGLEKGVKRVILPRKPYSRLFIDIAPLHGASIVADLAQRDFTINALALPVENISALTALPILPEQQNLAPLIDPFNGWRDLRARLLRAVQASVFQADPLRVLRAIRLCASRQLSIEPATARHMLRDAPLLSQVTPERIRNELLLMLAAPNVPETIRVLDEYHVFPAIFPTFYGPGIGIGSKIARSNPAPPGGKTWPTLTGVAALLSASQGTVATQTLTEHPTLAPILELSHRPVFKKRWKKSPGGAYPRAILFLLAALLTDLLHLEAHPANSPSPEQFQTISSALKRLTLGRQAAAFIVFLLQQRAAPFTVEPRPQAKAGAAWTAARHYFEHFGERGVDLASFSLARQMAALQSAPPDDAWQAQTHTCIDLLEAYYYERNALIPPALIDGQVIITRLGFTRGATIGAWLAKVRSAQLDGLIRTKAEALQFLAEHAVSSAKGHCQQEERGEQPA